ncbi:MAG: hypothetical protein ACLUNZ_00190 [Evtepia sp.]
MVEAENSPKLLRACATEAQDGQVIYTESERVVRTRKTSIELLMSDHDGDCRRSLRLEMSGQRERPGLCPGHRAG